MAYYVYTLSDPRTGTVFYVGKGKGGRIDQHEREALRGVRSPKCDRIREIQAAGLQIIKAKVARFASERAAYAHESQLINSLPGLTNGGQVNAPDGRALLLRLVRKARAGMLRPAGPWGRALLGALLRRPDAILLTEGKNAVPAGPVGQS